MRYLSMSAPLQKIGNFRLLYLVFIGILLVFGVFRWRSNKAIDFYQFWIVGQAIKTMDVSSVYSKPERARIGREFLTLAREQGSPYQLKTALKAARFWKVLEFAGTPFMYSVFYLISSGTYAVDYQVYLFLSLLAYFVGIGLLCRLLEFNTITTSIILCLSIFFWPFKMDMYFGNLNEIQLGLVALYLWIDKGSDSPLLFFLNGSLLGFMLMFKPNLFVMASFLALSWIFRKDYEKLLYQGAGMASAAAVSVLASHLILGPACHWHDWFLECPKIIYIHRYLKASFMSKMFGIGDLDVQKSLGFAVWLSGAILLWINRKDGPNQYHQSPSKDFFVVSLGLLSGLIAGPLVHIHYFIQALPAALFLMRPAPSAGASSKIFLLAGVIAIAFISSHPILRWLNLPTTPHVSQWTYWGVLILYISLLWKIIGCSLPSWVGRKL